MQRLEECEFLLVRYVPDPVKNEFVNIGVLLRAAAGGGESGDRTTLVRFTRNWGRVRCVDPEADTEAFEAIEGEIREKLARPSGVGKPILTLLEDSLSTNLQLTASQACLAENISAKMDQLMRMFVEPRKREAALRKSGRQVIYASMRSHFERAGVWDLMRKRIAAASYTRPGDPLRIDCGYRPNGVVRMFHAVSLEADTETAKVLAFSLAGLREGIKRVEDAQLELTAIVEPLGAWKQAAAAEMDGDRMDQYRFAVETMERERIRVFTTGDLARIAQTARQELRV